MSLLLLKSLTLKLLNKWWWDSEGYDGEAKKQQKQSKKE